MIISLKKVAMAVISTTILTAIMLAITANGVLAVTLFPLSMLLFLFIFGVTGQINLWVKVTKVIAIVFSIVALILCAKYFKVEAQEPELVSDSVVQTEPTDVEPEDTEGNNQDTTDGMTGNLNVDDNAGKVNYKKTNKSTGKGTKNPFGDGIKPSYSGGTADDKTKPTGKTKTEGNKVTDIESNTDEIPDKQKEEIEKDKNDGKNVITHPSGVITTSDDKTTNKDEDNTPQNPNLDTSNTDKASTTPETPKDPTNSKPTELPDDVLDKYKPNTPATDEKEDKEEPTTKPDDGDKEEEKLIPVTIRVDSTEAYAGDSIQFFVSGDIESVEGYTGVTVESIKNGTITINTPDIAQTITITVIGKDGSKASASVNVKKIGEPEKEEEKPQTPTVPEPDSTPVPDEKPTTEPEPTPVPDEKPEPVKPESKPATEDKDTTNQPVTDKKDESSNESEPKSNPVSITAIGGNTATAGESVQFKISGDVASIEGTSGFQTSQSNGILTVQTQEGVATVIYITVRGVDGSQASASVTVNCMINNNG